MTISSVFVLIATLFLCSGIGKLYSNRLYRLVYMEYKKDGESFFDCCCRVFNNSVWKVRKKLGIKWFYNSKLFRYSNLIRGILRICIAIIIYGIIIVISFTDYRGYLNVKI